MVCHSMSFPFYESWFIKLQVAIIGNHYTLRLSRELSPFEWIPGGRRGVGEMEKSWRGEEKEREREKGKREGVGGDRCVSSRYIKLLCHRQVNPHLTLPQTQSWSSCGAVSSSACVCAPVNSELSHAVALMCMCHGSHSSNTAVYVKGNGLKAVVVEVIWTLSLLPSFVFHNCVMVCFLSNRRVRSCLAIFPLITTFIQ